MRATCISRWKGENGWEAGAVAVGMTAVAVVVAVVAMVLRGSSGGTGGGGCSTAEARRERKVADGLELDCRRFCAQPSPAQDSPPA